MTRITYLRSAAAAVLALAAGCAPSAGPDVTKLITSASSQITSVEMKPPANMPGVCWGHIPGPQITQIVSDIVLATPAVVDASGRETAPAIYRKVTRPSTFNEGDGRWFTRTCDADMTPDFVMTLQRALQVRKYYKGPISGQLDPRTRRAVKEYQTPQGLDSSVLSQVAAQQLGLIAVELDLPAQDAG